MKLLRNPVVVALLVVGALAMVFWNVVRPMFPRVPRSVPQPSAMPTPAPAKNTVAPAGKPLAEQPATPPMSPATTIDLALARASSTRWMESPRRDPFQMRYLETSRRRVFRRAVELLSLSAVWRQTDGTLAVINNHVVGAGDTILDFKIENIEADRVWVEGPNGRESITFKFSSPADAGAEQSVPETKAAPASDDTNESLYQGALRSETIEQVSWGNGFATAKVGIIFNGLKFEMKQNIARLILDHANKKGGRCEYVILTDVYTNKKVGAYSEKLGLSLE